MQHVEARETSAYDHRVEFRLPSSACGAIVVWFSLIVEAPFRRGCVRLAVLGDRPGDMTKARTRGEAKA
jgi:hypothetical protein